jgi:hypothetical protein
VDYIQVELFAADEFAGEESKAKDLARRYTVKIIVRSSGSRKLILSPPG